ncbi:hypothetical protein GCM10027192_15500 [Psychrobacter pocilloporae]
MARAERVNKDNPRLSSKVFIWALTADWVKLMCRAAAAKLSNSQTATKVLSSLIIDITTLISYA